MEIVPPPSQPANIRKAIVAKRRLEVARLTLRGVSSAGIASELREKVATIQADRRANLRTWRKDTLGAEDDHRARLCAELAAVKSEAWTAWERSKAEQRKTTQKASPVKTGKPDDLAAGQMRPFEVTMEQKDSPGDPRFLERLTTAAALEAKLLGLLADPSSVAPPTVAPSRVSVLVIGDAGLPGDMPWLSNIPAGRAEQGKALLPPGEIVDAEAVEKG